MTTKKLRGGYTGEAFELRKRAASQNKANDIFNSLKRKQQEERK